MKGEADLNLSVWASVNEMAFCPKKGNHRELSHHSGARTWGPSKLERAGHGPQPTGHVHDVDRDEMLSGRQIAGGQSIGER